MSVSIGLPYTDQGGLLGLAIQSVLDQSFEDWELILVGDKPNAETRMIAHQFADPRIRFYENTRRIGLAATLNRITRLANFPLIARMDGDDVMHPSRISVQKKKFDETPSMDVLGSRAYLIDDETNLVGLFKEPELPTSGAGYFTSNAFTHPTVMATREWFLANPYNESLLRGEDKELWLRTWSYSKFVKIPDRLMYYRRSRSMPATRMQRDEAYNRHIMAMYNSQDKSKVSRFVRTLNSHTKEALLGAIGAFGLSPMLFNTKWLAVDAGEYYAAQQVLEAIRIDRPAQTSTLNAVAATVTYGDRYQLVERTVTAALNAGAAKVIVVDNGSEQRSKASLDSLAESDSRVVVVKLAQNRGSAEGFATAIRSFLQTDGDYLWLLDDDNECEPRALQELVRAANLLAASTPEGPSAVCALRPSNPGHAAIARGASVTRVYPPNGSFMSFDIAHRLVSFVAKLSMPRPANRALVDIPYGPYGGLLVSRDSLRMVGLPNSVLGLYEDDTEFTARFSKQGGRLALCKSAKVNDIDAKWTESNGHLGLAGLLHATDSKRTYFAVRNRVAFDVDQSPGGRKSWRLRFNGCIFRIILWVLAAKYGKTFQAREISEALGAGLRKDFSRSFSDA